MKYKTHTHKLRVEKDRGKGVLSAPILVKDWNINARIYTTRRHPSNFLAKFDLPGVWSEQVGFGGAKN